MDSSDYPEPTEAFEIETVLREGKGQKRSVHDLDHWRYEKTDRTADHHPIRTSPETTDRPVGQWNVF
jgi:hypothetical protein